MSVQRGNDSGLQRGPEDPYLNNSLLFHTNSWDASSATQQDFDVISGRDAQKTVEIDSPDDHLVELWGFRTHTGDPAEGSGKFDYFVVNDADPPQTGQGWPIHGQVQDDLIFSAHHQSDSTNGAVGDDTQDIFYPKPILSTGKLGVLSRSGTSDVGEAAAMVYYTFREFDENTVMQQLIERE